MEKIENKDVVFINKVLDKWLDYQLMYNRIRGMSIGIVYKNKIILKKAYGYSDRERQIKNTTNTRFRIASISKLFTAIMLMKLVEEEKINLDERVGKYLRWFVGKDKKPLFVTIRQLLTHSSGITRDGNIPYWENDRFPDTTFLKKYLQKEGITNKALEKFKYSNIGYALLSEIIRKVSGEKYEDYVKEKIIKELELTDTFPDSSEEAVKNLSVGYGRELMGFQQPKFFGRTSTKSLASATGFISNVQDLCELMISQFPNNDKIISKEYKKEMQRIHWLDEEEGVKWGLGYEIWKVNGNKVVGHSGGFPGYTTIMGFCPDKEIGAVVLTNSMDVDTYQIFGGILSTVLRAADWKEKTKKSNKKLKKYEGRFHGRFGDVEIIEINNKLYLFYPDNNKPLDVMSSLKQIRKDVFLTERKNNFYYNSEEVKYNFFNGIVESILVGGSLMIPFEKVEKTGEFLK